MEYSDLFEKIRMEPNFNWFTQNLYSDIENLINSGDSKSQFIAIVGSEENYRALRQRLSGTCFTTGTIVPLRGRAGGLKFVKKDEFLATPSIPTDTAIQEAVEKSDETKDEELRLEKHFYPLVQRWAKESGYTECCITGGKVPGYKWENPDLINIDMYFDAILKKITYEITSIEVKLSLSPESIWQAAHYKRF